MRRMFRCSISMLSVLLLRSLALAEEPLKEDRSPVIPVQSVERPGGSGSQDRSGRGVAPGESRPAWTESEIIAAKDECLRILGPIRVTIMQRPPIRQGRCGAPAPMLLQALHAEPSIALAPPQPLTCTMIVAMHEWSVHVVQPLAKAILDEPITEFRGLSSYQCRDIAGRKGEISEHALVNAIDISRFVTKSGRVVDVKRVWGPTRRDAPHATESTAPDGSPNKKDGAVRGGRTREVRPTTALSADRAFLHRVHAGACRYFATVLGPEANEDHRDHFHLDMGGRPGGICE